MTPLEEARERLSKAGDVLEALAWVPHGDYGFAVDAAASAVSLIEDLKRILEVGN